MANAVKAGESRWLVPSIVTCRSSIASSSAACVRGGMRLISSTSSRSVNTGPWCSVKALVRHVEDVGADDVGGHQVGRALHALELQAQDARERADRQRLGQAGHAFEQRVAAADDRQQQQVDHLGLPDDHLGELAARVSRDLVRVMLIVRFRSLRRRPRVRAANAWSSADERHGLRRGEMPDCADAARALRQRGRRARRASNARRSARHGGETLVAGAGRQAERGQRAGGARARVRSRRPRRDAGARS